MIDNPSDLERLLADLDANQRDGEAHFDFGIRLARARLRLDALAPDLARKVITLQARVEELEGALWGITSHECTVPEGHMECENCKDAFFDDYFTVKALARAALQQTDPSHE